MKFRVVAQMKKKMGFLGSARRIRFAEILVVITGIGAAGGLVSLPFWLQQKAAAKEGKTPPSAK